MFCLLHIYIILSFVDFSYGNYEVIQCERTNINISCENDTDIVINEVHFGPQTNIGDNGRNHIAELQMDTSNISSFCNDKKSCYTGNMDENYFKRYPALPRWVNISYNCYHEGYEFVGCYKDSSERLFRGPDQTETKIMSASICKDFCSKQKGIYPYFGTENSNECFCGYLLDIKKLNENKTIYEKRPTNECDAPCAANPKETCGKHGLISVYQVKKEYSFLGCFNDNNGDLFSGKHFFGAPKMSASICRSFCSRGKNVYKYFGTKQGNACVCGKDTDRSKLNEHLLKYNNDIFCHISCKGHPNEHCGSKFFISVYESIFDPLQKATVKARDISHISLCSLKMMNVRIESHQISDYCERENLKTTPGQKEITWINSNHLTNGLDLDAGLTKYVRINYSCEVKSDPTVLFTSGNKKMEDKTLIGIVAGVVSGICLVGAVLTGIFIAKRKQINNKRQTEPTQVRSNTAVLGESESLNIQGEDDNNINKSFQRDNAYSTVCKIKQKSESSRLGQENTTFLLPDDVYVDTAEGVYDVSHKQREKYRNIDQAIYSHTTEGVYDSTTTQNCVPNDDENAYDQGFHQVEHNVYYISA